MEETERPQFVGREVKDEQGERRKIYSPWKRLLKYALTVPVLTALVFAMLVIMAAVFYTQNKLEDEYLAGERLDFSPQLKLSSLSASHHQNIGTSANVHSNNNQTSINWSLILNEKVIHDPAFWTVTFLYPCFYSLAVIIATSLYEKLAVKLNDFENHRTLTTHLNRLILKVFSFRVVTIFTALFYYAFASVDTEEAYLRIAVTIFTLMTVGQWWSVLLEVCLPALVHRAVLHHLRVNTQSTNRKIYEAKSFADEYALNQKFSGTPIAMRELIEKREQYLEQAKSQCWEESLLPRYTPFPDYTDLVAQMGFILLFGAVFPLAPLIALINNIVLIRLNAFKLCHTRQRPIAQRASGIGVWEDVVQIMSVGGILTNFALMGFNSTDLRSSLNFAGDVGIALVLFAFEHVILLFKYWLHTTIPQVPASV